MSRLARCCDFPGGSGRAPRWSGRWWRRLCLRGALSPVSIEGIDDMTGFMKHGRLITAAVAVAGVLGVGAVTALPGDARSAGPMYTIVSGNQTVGELDAPPAGYAKGMLSLGDQVTASGPITRNGGVKGTEALVFTVSDPRPVPAGRAHGYVSGAYHLANGDLYLEAYASFDNSAVVRGAVVGGTGAYADARGVFTGKGSRTTIQLAP